jgi:hypothetical protein
LTGNRGRTRLENLCDSRPPQRRAELAVRLSLTALSKRRRVPADGRRARHSYFQWHAALPTRPGTFQATQRLREVVPCIPYTVYHLLGKIHATQEILEARVGAERVKVRPDLRYGQPPSFSRMRKWEIV